MAPMTDEDLEWFKSTFRPIPKPQLPEDCIEYSIFVISQNAKAQSDNEVRDRLREVQKASTELQRSLVKHYVWQRESYTLELTKENGTSLLRGRTEYGDSVEDEWVIVYILRELSKKFDDIWIKVSDSDGEFLLIEAAGALPAWLEPEVADNRVWINKGQLVIIRQDAPGTNSKQTATGKLSPQDASEIILSNPKQLLRSPTIEEEAFFRLRNYPQQIKDNQHHALVTVPRKIAHLLHQKPSYISPAIEAFYVRDPIALKPLKEKDTSKLTFPAEDLVTISVKFPRVGFAQLKSQEFPTPQAWQNAMSQLDPEHDENAADIGMKMACGFEMLVTDGSNQDKHAVREIKLILEDLETEDDRLPTDAEIEIWDKTADNEDWLNINFEDLEGELDRNVKAENGTDKKSRKKPAPFGDQAAQENLQRIVAQFERFLNDDTAGIDGADFDSDSDVPDNDDDDELSDEDGFAEDKEASFDEEEFSKAMREMMGLPADAINETSTAPTNQLREMGTKEGLVKKDPASLGGHAKVEDLGSDDENELDDTAKAQDEEAPFDEDEFSKMMCELMGMPADVMKEIMNAPTAQLKDDKARRELVRKHAASFVSNAAPENLDSDAENEIDDTEEIQNLMKRMEMELNETGALNLDPTPRKLKAVKGKGKQKVEEDDSDEGDDGEDYSEDIDINLARNLLESFKSQTGMAGPGGNLLGMLGLQLPRDSDDVKSKNKANQ